MGKRIRIRAESAMGEAELNETPTATMLWKSLPVEGFANTWGQEVYFKIPVDAEMEDNARQVMEKGEIAYWPMGQAFCIFFGPTPASRGNEIRAYSPVNVLGRIVGDPAVFQNVKDGERVVLEHVE